VPSEACPFCGRPRIRLTRRGVFLCWWHPVAGRYGYIRCGEQVRAERDLVEMDRP
jgi:hypothetical protein